MRESELKEGVIERVNLRGHYICLSKVEGQVFAFDSECPHKGGPLHYGQLEGRGIRCPWHRYVFSLEDGRLLESPFGSKFGKWREAGNLRIYQITIESGQISVEVQ